MNRMKNLGRRITCVLLAAAVGLSVGACSPQEGSNSIQEESSFQGASEAPESREETQQENPSSSASSLQESAPSQQEDDPSADPSFQSSAVESTVSPEPSGLAAEDFYSPEGDFTYLELEYGTPAQVVLPLFGLSGAEPDREWESNGGGTHSEYRAGAMNMDGASFALTLGFLDGLLNSFTFTCDAQEGEDLSPLYEDLRAHFGSLYGLPEEESVLEDVLAPAQEERGKDLLYDIQRFSSVVEEEGERATRLSLSLIELDGAGVQVELSLALYQ